MSFTLTGTLKDFGSGIPAGGSSFWASRWPRLALGLTGPLGTGGSTSRR